MRPSLAFVLPLSASVAGFVLCEAAAGRWYAEALDPAITLYASVQEGAGLLTCFAIIGVVVGLLAPSRPALGTALALGLWALVWGPDAARAGRLPELLGLLPAAVMFAGALRWPWLACGLGALGGLAAPALRTRGCVAPKQALYHAPAGPDVLLITVDATRVDSALVDGFHGAGWWTFDAAIAPAPWTLPSMYSVFNGVPVAVHQGGLAVDGGYSQPVSPRSFVTAFADAGWRTMAFVSNPHLRADLGFSSGFTDWTHDDDARAPLLFRAALDRRVAAAQGRANAMQLTRDERVVDAAVRALGAPHAAGERRFVWVHLLGVHEYARDPVVLPSAAADQPDAAGAAAALRAAYAASVDSAAERVHRLVSAAGADALVVITSDHGEELGERGVFGHGHALQDTELRVPLVVRIGDSGGRVEAQAATVGLYALFTAIADGRVLNPSDALQSERVRVGGVRRSAAAFAVRHADGSYALEDSRAVEPGVAAPEDAVSRDALRALGYAE
jgi:arylsulfatase